MNTPGRRFTFAQWAEFRGLTPKEREVVKIAARSRNPDKVLRGAFGGYPVLGMRRHDWLLRAVLCVWDDERTAKEAA